MKKTLEIKLQIPTMRIVDLFISACEGGSNYWCKELTPTRKTGDAYEAMLAGFTVTVLDSGKKIKVTPAAITRALSLFVAGGVPEKYGAESWLSQHFADWQAGNEDATTADVFLQLCTFGRCIYG